MCKEEEFSEKDKRCAPRVRGHRESFLPPLSMFVLPDLTTH